MSDPNKSPRTAFQPPPTLIPTPAGGAPTLIPGDSQGVDNDVTDHLKVQLLVRAYQVGVSLVSLIVRSEVITKRRLIHWG
jgi:2-oxoglutarate dehydrogenase E1 component